MSALDHVWKRTGGHAYPHEEPGNFNCGGSTVHHGMTLQDYFAAKAMQGIIGREKQPEGCNTYDDLATMAYEMADAMLAAREAK